MSKLKLILNSTQNNSEFEVEFAVEIGVQPFYGQKQTNVSFFIWQKNTIFPKKSLKTYYFWLALAGQGGRGGARAPSCPPLLTPMDQKLTFQPNKLVKKQNTINQNLDQNRCKKVEFHQMQGRIWSKLIKKSNMKFEQTNFIIICYVLLFIPIKIF